MAMGVSFARGGGWGEGEGVAAQQGFGHRKKGPWERWGRGGLGTMEDAEGKRGADLVNVGVGRLCHCERLRLGEWRRERAAWGGFQF